MQQLTGRFADLNTSNMLVGEFAVPNDHNPVVKMDNGKIREIPLLSDMDSYENKIQEVNNAMTKLNNEYESTKNQLVAATKANADSAAKSAAAAATSETNANTYKNNAASSATAAASSASSASTYKDNAKTYMDNANAYAKEAKTAASSITGALKPKGTVTFANLPALSTVEAGAMYNISTAFTSNGNFKDGGNITYPAGTNVYKTEDGMWDCLAGELSDYLMKDDIDTAVEESMPDYTASTQLAELVSGEKLSTALGKIKTAVKNVISLVKLLGTTDISKIGNGTVTGAISSLNSNLDNKLSHWKYIGYMKANNGEPDVLTFSIPSGVSTLLIVYEDKAVFQPTGLAAPPLIIPLDQADDRYYVPNMFSRATYYSWGRIGYSVQYNALYFNDFACNFDGITISKPWISIYAL